MVEQLIRPTGLLDPIIEVRPTANQVDDLMEEIQLRIERQERTLVTTLTKRMAEELTDYLSQHGIQTAYIHSDVATLERVRIMNDLRSGKYDVLVGVNLLREGLDLPEVSLVAILDADKEGFLRSHRSLTQTIGRAARHVNGRAIMYADNMTESMARTISDTDYRREKQMRYNQEHGIVPQQIRKQRTMDDLVQLHQGAEARPYVEAEVPVARVAEDLQEWDDPNALSKKIASLRKKMQEAARKLDFIEAAQLRDEMIRLEEVLKELTEK